MRKQIIITLFILLLGLSGCSESTLKNNTYYQLILAIERSINDDRWDVASKQVETLKIYYEQNSLILKEIGDNDEYLLIEDGIEGLRIAINEKEKNLASEYITISKRELEGLFNREEW